MSHLAIPIQTRLRKKALIIEDDEFTRKSLMRELEKLGFEIKEAGSLAEARASIQQANSDFDLVLSDIHLPDGNALSLCTELHNSAAESANDGVWVFITGDPDPDLLQKAIRAGGFGLLRKPFSRSDLRSLLEKIASQSSDPVRDIMAMIEEISGIKLGNQKAMLVEGRLHQRARELGLTRLETYLNHFKAHRNTEISELISLISTHTTEFFREAEHFDFMVKEALPNILATGRPVRIWSAACSSGEEVYSIAMMIHRNFLSTHGNRAIPSRSGSPPLFDILGTDLDRRSVERATNGVYSESSLQKIPAEYAAEYMDRGTGDLAKWTRVRNVLHGLCRFRTANLLSKDWPVKSADLIFLRNALMYFPPELALQVVERAKSILPDDGYLFLGHSEAGLGIKAGMELVAPAVYMRKRR